MTDDREITVSFTSRFMAAIRSLESKREKPLFTDPLAAKLAGDDVIARALELDEQKSIAYVQIRTKFFDDFLTNNLSKSRQVVLLGAGLDTRAFRLDFPEGVSLFEVDRVDAIVYKNAILTDDDPNCSRYSIVGDLA